MFCKTAFQVGMDLSKDRNKAGTCMKKNSRTLPTSKQWQPPLWPPMQCTCIPNSLCMQQSELGMQVHGVGVQ